MGCRQDFVVDHLEELVDEGDSRSSSRAHEHENFRLVSQLHVAIQVLWSQCPPRWTVWTNRLVVQSQRVSPFYHDLASGLGWVGWLTSACRATSKPNSFIQSCLKEIFGGIRGDSYFFVYDFYSFHPNNFRDTISWECIVKNDSVRSRLMELQSFLLSKFDIDPIHHVLMFLRILAFFVHGIQRQKEYCLSFAQMLTSRHQSWIDDGMQFDCTSNVINILEETVRDLEELGGNEFLLKHQYNTEIFSCFLLLLLSCCSSTFHQTNVENTQMFLKIIFYSPEFNCSIIFSRLTSMTRRRINFFDSL